MIEEALRLVRDSGGRATLAQLRARFPQVGSILRKCLDQELLVLEGDCYALGPLAANVFAAAALVGTMKRCPGCGCVLPHASFWKDAGRSDGLYPYCVGCVNKRRLRVMQEKQHEARERIRAAGAITARCARRWDDAVAELARAWRDIVLSDTIMREHRKAAGSDTEYGRMEARLLHPRAMFALALALTDVGFPLGFAVHRESGMQPKLASYVGKNPERDYIGNEEVTLAPVAAPVALPRKRRKYKRRKDRKPPEVVVDEAVKDLQAVAV